MNAFNLGQQTDRMSLDEFELASIDERLVARFDGTLNDWWSIFWTSVAASVAKEARAKYYGQTKRRNR